MVGMYGAFAALVAVLSLAPVANASFPGRNGRIWYTHHVVDLGAETGPRGFDSEVLESFAPTATANRVDSLFGCPPGCHDGRPALAPDGRSIAFNRAAQNGLSNRMFWVAAPDGSALRQVPIFGWSPQWSPSGKRLVFGRGMFGAGRIYTVRLDGKRLRPLTGGHRDGGPAWSIKGLIVFQRAVANRDGEDLFTIRANGRGLRRLTHGGGGTPDWSPDGKRVAFMHHNHIYVIDANGQRLLRLTHGSGSDPAWSPDGRWIAFTSGNLYVMRSNGRGLRRLLAPPPTGHPERRGVLRRPRLAVASAASLARRVPVAGAPGMMWLMERKWWTLLAVCVATFMLLVDITIVNVALPSIQEDLDASLTDLQWVVDAYALMLSALMLTVGSLADRVGRRLVFMLGVLIFTVASLLCGLAPTATNARPGPRAPGHRRGGDVRHLARADRPGVPGARVRHGDRRLGLDRGRRRGRGPSGGRRADRRAWLGVDLLRQRPCRRDRAQPRAGCECTSTRTPTPAGSTRPGW